MMTFFTESAEETISLGFQIGKLLKAGDVIAMQGTLAAGKTTITKGIADGLDIKEEVTSPTFTLVSEYNGRIPLYHVDAYRLNDSNDFMDLGGEELLYSKGVCIIEWSEKISDVIPDEAIYLNIKILDSNKREIAISNWHYGALKNGTK